MVLYVNDKFINIFYNYFLFILTYRDSKPSLSFLKNVSILIIDQLIADMHLVMPLGEYFK